MTKRIFTDNIDSDITYEYCSEEVKAKTEGIKMMVRYLYGLKLNTLLGESECDFMNLFLL